MSNQENYRRQVYGGKVQWICNTYISKGKKACSSIRLDDKEVCRLKNHEPTIVKEEIIHGLMARACSRLCTRIQENQNMTEGTSVVNQTRKIRMAAYCRVSTSQEGHVDEEDIKKLLLKLIIH